MNDSKNLQFISGNLENYAVLANDCQVPPSTTTEYVALLEDTLVGFLLPAWTESKKRKATKKISSNDLKGLKYLKEEGVFQNFILVSQDPVSTLTENILTIPWQKFLSDLWKDKFV